MISNEKYWDLLLEQEKLYSLLKDGTPQGFFERIIGFAYPLFLVILTAICVIAYLKISKSKWRWKTHLFSITLGTLSGAVWCIWMQKFDPQYPGWLFPPWAATGVDFGLTLEDWIFLPVSTTLFYIFYRMVNVKDMNFTKKNTVHGIIIGSYCILSSLALLFTETAGRTEILLFILPGIVLYLYSRDIINVKKFLFFQVFVVLFEIIWDCAAVSWLHYIPGLSWSSQWLYLSFDSNGNYYHSKIFLDYGTHRYAWVFMNPIEITPLFGMCGGLLNYAMFTAGDKFFYGGREGTQ